MKLQRLKFGVIEKSSDKYEKKNLEYRQNVVIGYWDSLRLLVVCLLLRGSCTMDV